MPRDHSFGMYAKVSQKLTFLTPDILVRITLLEKCPHLELFWHPIFPYSYSVYSVSIRIRSECGKMQTRITPNTDTFYAVPGGKKCQSFGKFCLHTSESAKPLQHPDVNL